MKPMVDLYAIVRRLTGHELISPKDARLLTEAVDGLIDEIGSKDACIAELEAENERLKQEIAVNPASQPSVKVKPLEWVASDDWEHRWTADLYAIEDQGKNWSADRYWLYYNGQRLGKFGTLDTALFTAQADYDRRILSALTAGKPEPASGTDYFGSLVERARASATKASAKFPQPNYVTLKIAEEAGEVIRGAVHYAERRMEWSEVEGEIIQLLAMLIRFVTEGDQVNGIVPPTAGGGE